MQASSSALATTGPPRPRKRLIVCCDGTWLDSSTTLQDNKIPIPSNVTRISRAIRNKSADGIAQVVYYQAGVGSTGNIINRVIGGATAEGLSENIREGYAFLANNYSMGDEIFFFGFSRGAFTARSIAGMVGDLGLLTKAGLPCLAEVFLDFENRLNPRYRPVLRNVPFPNKPSAGNPLYREELERRGLTRLGVEIKAIGVWDTVGSLGIPRIGWLDKLGLQSRSMKEYMFFDTSLSNRIENAFQALALDEERAAFSPSVWEKKRGNTTNLRQVWFPGAHSNVGGGSYDDEGQADITLAWMMAQMEPFLDFEPEYILDQYELTRKYYIKSGQKPRPWSFGEIYKSNIGVYMLDGTVTRTPGYYYRVDPETGRETSKQLRQTNEYVHPSARSRIELGGPGVQDHGYYDPMSLTDYKLKFEENDLDRKRPFAIWVSRSRDRGAARKVLPESPLWRTEKELFDASANSEIYDYIMGGPSHSRRR